ncbi:MAG: PilZ domain-containing protein [Treponema sp.]|jgi:hypothetical protein|nr:PilZ domain-containing protein [Treponema sp.]
MQERRKDIRYPTLARARIPAVSEKDAVLSDLSITGCRIRCTEHIPITLNTPYTVLIIPEPAAKISTFALVVESRWIRSQEHSFEAAFMIVSSPPVGTQFESYVDYLAWRSAAL